MAEDIQIHERVKGLEVKVDTIMNNHLPHIQKKVDKVNDKLWWLIGLFITGLISLVVYFLRQ